MKDSKSRKIAVQGNVIKNKKGGQCFENSYDCNPTPMKEFGAIDSLKEIGRLFRGKR